MADHFEEVINLRLHQLDERIDDEANAVKAHFEELKTFVTESLNTQTAQLRIELKAELGPMKADIRTLKTDVAVLKADVATLKTDVAVLKTDVAELKTDVAGLKSDVATLKIDVGDLKSGFTSLRTEVGDLRGDVRRLERQFAAHEEANRLEFKRLENKMDVRFDGVHAVLRDILGRLPPPESRRT